MAQNNFSLIAKNLLWKLEIMIYDKAISKKTDLSATFWESWKLFDRRKNFIGEVYASKIQIIRNILFYSFIYSFIFFFNGSIIFSSILSG